jgi:hypothetical protein
METWPVSRLILAYDLVLALEVKTIGPLWLTPESSGNVGTASGKV